MTSGCCASSNLRARRCPHRTSGRAARRASLGAVTTAFADLQAQIYMGGLSGSRPELPISWPALERHACDQLDEVAWDYLAGGAGIEDTVRANHEALERWRIVPRMLRDVSQRELARTLIGTTMAAPIMVAPIGVQSLMHPDGELAVARAAASLGVPMVVSTVSSFSLEAVAEAGGGAPQWFQLYWPSDSALAASLISRAEAAGYRALVVTLDNPLLGWRPRELQAAYVPFFKGVGLANYVADPVFRAGLDRSPEEDPGAALGRFISVLLGRLAHLGSPLVSTREDRPSDRSQGHSGSRGCRSGPRSRC